MKHVTNNVTPRTLGMKAKVSRIETSLLFRSQSFLIAVQCIATWDNFLNIRSGFCVKI
jgi:hypothetical protein